MTFGINLHTLELAYIYLSIVRQVSEEIFMCLSFRVFIRTSDTYINISPNESHTTLGWSFICVD